MKSDRRIGICGAHGTGKSTIISEYQKLDSDIAVFDNSIREWLAACKERGHDYSDIWIRGSEKTQILYLMRHELMLTNRKEFNFITARTPIDILGYYMLLPDTEHELYGWFYDHAVDLVRQQYSEIFYIPIEFPLIDEQFRYKENTRQPVQDAILKVLTEEDIPFTTLSGSVENRINTMCNSLRGE